MHPSRVPAFHYTSSDAALAILESGKFRLYDKFKQADINEFTGIDFFLEKLKTVKKTNVHTEHFVEVYEKTLPPAVKDSFFWGIGSFTRVRDSNRHWDSYAQNGSGVRLGFSSFESSWSAPDKKQTRMFDYCMHYDEGAIKDDQSELVRLLVSILGQEMTEFDYATANEILKELSICVSPGVLQHALFYKLPEFSWEEEVRVLVAGDVHFFNDILKSHDGRRFIEVPLFPLLDITVGSKMPSEKMDRLEAAAAKYGIPFLVKNRD